MKTKLKLAIIFITCSLIFFIGLSLFSFLFEVFIRPKVMATLLFIFISGIIFLVRHLLEQKAQKSYRLIYTFSANFISFALVVITFYIVLLFLPSEMEYQKDGKKYIVLNMGDSNFYYKTKYFFYLNNQYEFIEKR